MSAGDRLALLTPANVRHRSGGTLFNRAVTAHAATLGHRVDLVPVPGHWPRPDRQAVGRVLAAAAGHRRVLVDGLIATRCPEVLIALTARGIRTGLLVHLPERHGGTAQARALAAADVVVVTSAWTGHWLLAHAWPVTGRPAADLAARLVVARPGTEADPARRKDPSPEHSATEQPIDRSPVLACVAALTPNKNQAGLVRALAGLTDLAWSAELIGSTDADPRYAGRVAAAASSLPGRVRITGELDAAGLAARWSRTDLLVLPSTWESWGMVVPEALRHGVPVVVGRGTGAAEALTGPRGSGPWPRQRTDGRSLHARRVAGKGGRPGDRHLPGAVVDADDPTSIAAVLRRWLTDPPLRTRWRTAAGTADLPGWGPATEAILTAMGSRTGSRPGPRRPAGRPPMMSTEG